MPASTKEEIINAIKKIKNHLLPTGQRLDWHDDKIENDLKQTIEAYEVLKEHEHELQDANKVKLVEWLAAFLPIIYSDYQHGTVDELRNFSTDQIDEYLIKIAGWFEEKVKMEEIKTEKIIQTLKNGGYTSILFTTDLHLSDVKNKEEQDKIIKDVSEIMQYAAQQGARVAIDLGDLGKSDKFYNELAQKNNLEGGMTVSSLFYSSKKETLDLQLNNLLIYHEKILPIHFINYQKIALTANEEYKFDTYEILKKLLKSSKSEPILIICGHSHIGFYAKVLRETGIETEIKTIFTSLSYDGEIIWRLRPDSDSVEKTSGIETLKEVNLKEAGLYILCPGYSQVGDCLLLNIQNKEYTAKWIGKLKSK